MTNRAKYILHIGRNKTGTTALQQFFSRHRETLKKVGVLYPDIGIAGSAHHGIASFFAPKRFSLYPLQSAWHEQLTQASRAYPTILLSSEAFSVRNPRKVAEYFPPSQTRVVIFLREHVHYMTSWYQQSVKASNTTLGLRAFVEQHRSPHVRLVERWMQVYGRENVTVRVYDRKRFRGGSVVNEFVDVNPELQGVDLADVEADFTSISGNLLYLKRCMNAFLSVEESLSVARDLLKLNRLDPTFTGRIFVPRSDVSWIRDQFQDDQRVLRNAFGIEFDERPTEIEGACCPDLDRIERDWQRLNRFAVDQRLPIRHFFKDVRPRVRRSLDAGTPLRRAA